MRLAALLLLLAPTLAVAQIYRCPGNVFTDDKRPECVELQVDPNRNLMDRYTYVRDPALQAVYDEERAARRWAVRRWHREHGYHHYGYHRSR